MTTTFIMPVPGTRDSGKRHTVTAPWNGETIGEVSVTDSSAAEKAMQVTYDIFRDKQRWLQPEERIAVLSKAAEIMQQRAESLAHLAAHEGGKPLKDSRVEVARAIDSMRICVECLRTEGGREIPMNLNAASANRLAMTHREPIGVVLAFSAFNHPVNLIVHQIGPAIASGCPVIIKPAGDTPLSCFALVEILREAGLPDEYCIPVMPENLDVTTQLATDERVGFFSFIGSAKVGWMLRSKITAGARCALEHGGVAPVIVSKDADLDDCLPLLAKGGLYHAGQVCVSVQRVFVHSSIVQELTSRLAKLADAMTIGDPTSADTDVGPLIRHAETDRIEGWVNEAIAQGATLVTGGKRLSDAEYVCTVLLNPAENSRVSTQEIFGPVICVYSYDDIDKAIAQANSLPYAFQASVMTRDIDTAMHCYKGLDAAAVMINDHTAFRVDWMPFAGLKHSGLGVGGIPYTFSDMQIDKLMVMRSKQL